MEMGTLKNGKMLRPYVAVSIANALIVLVLAVLGGQYFTGNTGLITGHGHLANLLFLLVVAQTALAFLLGAPGRLGRSLIALGALTTLITSAQIGLGYAGRSNYDLVAIHVPNGVLIFGLAVAALAQYPRLAALAARESGAA